MTLENERYISVEAYKLILVANVDEFSVKDSLFMNLRTPEICSLNNDQDPTEVTSFFNSINITTSLIKNSTYIGATLGMSRVLLRWTDCNSVSISENIFNALTYFYLSRVAVIQDSSSLLFQGNRFLTIHTVDPFSKYFTSLISSLDSYMIWLLNTHEESHNTLAQFLDNNIQVDRKIGFLMVDNEETSAAITLEYRNQSFESAYNIPV